MNIAKIALSSGAIFGGLAVAAGAFGAHGLAEGVSPERLETFATGAQYQMTHALALLAIGILAIQFPNLNWKWITAGFITGTLLFSGSLYALVLLDIAKLGMITPFGGIIWIISWVSLAWRCSTGLK